MRFDSLCSLFLVAAIACGGDDDDDGTAVDAGLDADIAVDASPVDAGAPDASQNDGGADGDRCGGFANLQCEPTHFCDWEENSCGDGDLLGTCRPRPLSCDPVPPRVCGCNGQAYDSECAANMAGEDISEEVICKLVSPP